MRPFQVFIILTDWLLIVAVALLLIAVYASWLASYRTPKDAPSGLNVWYRMPSWAQITVGMGGSLFGALLFYWLWIPLPLSLSAELALILRAAGVVQALTGIGLWFQGRWMLGDMMTVSTASATQLTTHHRLIQSGAYGMVRHPMYVGYWLLLLGLLLVYRTWMPLIVLVLMVASLTRRAHQEDLALEARFGDAWRGYAARVPGFIPHLRR